MVQLTAVAVSEGLSLPPEGTRGEVHSIYKDYINILVSGRLVALFRSGCIQIPFGIEVAIKESWLEFDLKPGQPVRFLADDLLVGDELIIRGLKGCPIFLCKPDVKDFHSDSEMLKRLDLLSKLCMESDKDGGIVKYLGQFEPSNFWVRRQFSGDLLGVRVQQKVEALVTGILQNDNFLIMEGVCGLLGVGPGLTPSGDDFILGFLSGLMYLGKVECSSAAGKMAYQMGVNAPLMTTIVSVEYIKYAVGGMLHQRLVEFIAAFSSKETEELMKRALQVLKLGHSSGGDLLIGFVYGGYAALHVRGSR